MDHKTDFLPRLLEEAAYPGETHSFRPLYSAVILPDTEHAYRYALQWCEVCGLVQMGPWFEQASGATPLYDFLLPGQPDYRGGLDISKRPDCQPHCYKCLRTMDLGATGLVNDGDDSMGPPVCCDCYEAG